MNKFSSLFLHLQVKTVHIYPRGIFLFLLQTGLHFQNVSKNTKEKDLALFFLDKDAYNFS